VIDQATTDPDRALVAEAAGGSREAFDALVRRHEVRIFNLARALVGRDGDADDLAQETFIRAWRAIGRFRGESAFRTWLYRVAINVVRSHLAQRARQRWMWGWFRETPGETPVDPAGPPQPDVEETLVRRDAIDRALASLSPDLRMAVTLRDVEGLGYREIAETLGVPIGTVMSRIARGRARLRPLLAPLLVRERKDES
jgi:RNA polymerase sigma-70 factor, ECF subfamily